LSSGNICIGVEATEGCELPGYKRKMQKRVEMAVHALCVEFGFDHLAFLTITTEEKVYDMRVFQDMLHSVDNELRERYPNRVRVIERRRDGSLHSHEIVVLPFDCRTGFDFEALGQARGQRGRSPEVVRERQKWTRIYAASACAELRAEWAWLRSLMPRFGLGRHSLEPVRTSVGQMASYLSKYVSKGWAFRLPEDKGARMVRFCGIVRGVWRLPWAWAGGRAREWRQKVKVVAGWFGCQDYEAWSSLAGRCWAWRLLNVIEAVDLANCGGWSEAGFVERCLKGGDSG
jgi:hypothetical protein